MINIKLNNTVIEWALTINNAYIKTRDYPITQTRVRTKA